MVPFRGTDDPNLPVANRLASEFDELGKVEAVVWSLSDPIFRAAATSGKVRHKDSPTLEEAIMAADALSAEYILVAQAFRNGGAYKGKVELFKGGKSIWKDEQNITVGNSSANDAESSLLSLARSLAMRINSEPLKGLVSQKAAQTPALTQGQAPVQVSVPAAQPVKKDNGPVIRDGQSLMKAGRPAAAIQSLRDAVD